MSMPESMLGDAGGASSVGVGDRMSKVFWHQ
jgi:hypothetical protein